MFWNDTEKFSPHALKNSQRQFNTIDKSCTATPNKYPASFIRCVDFIIYSGGEVGLDPDMVKNIGFEIWIGHR